jgi:hypothetical protein
MHDPCPLTEHARIAKLAYRYWEERGRPDGSPDVDWQRAVATLVAEVNERFEETFVFSPGMGKRTC